MDHEEAKKIAERFISFVESHDTEVFAADVFCDINVPEWRFQLQGAEAAAEWLTGEEPDGSRVTSWRSDPTSSGAVVEVVQMIGDDLSRNLHRLEVHGGKVVEWTMYCTGVWTPEVQERQRSEAPMIRP